MYVLVHDSCKMYNFKVNTAVQSLECVNGTGGTSSVQMYGCAYIQVLFTASRNVTSSIGGAGVADKASPAWQYCGLLREGMIKATKHVLSIVLR